MAGASQRVSRHVTLRAAVRAGSGAPTSRIASGFSWEASDPVLGEGDLAGTPLRVGDGINDLELPAYVRVDFGVRAGWGVRLGGRQGSVSTFLTIENLANRSNLLTYRVDPATGALLPLGAGPSALNAGVQIEF
jgi:hypothetical protein